MEGGKRRDEKLHRRKEDFAGCDLGWKMYECGCLTFGLESWENKISHIERLLNCPWGDSVVISCAFIPFIFHVATVNMVILLKQLSCWLNKMRMKTLQLIFRDSPSFLLKEVILSGDAGAHPSEQAGVRLSSHRFKKKPTNRVMSLTSYCDANKNMSHGYGGKLLWIVNVSIHDQNDNA